MKLIIRKQPSPSPSTLFSGQLVSRVCLANQVGGEEATEKPFLEERLATREANEKMVLQSLAYSSDTPKSGYLASRENSK
jgi:hypothetical protein